MCESSFSPLEDTFLCCLNTAILPRACALTNLTLLYVFADEGAQIAEHHCCLCRRDFVSAHALNVHVSQVHGSGAPVSNGASHQLVLPIVTKRVGEAEAMDVDEDEEEALRMSRRKMMPSIKQELVPNVVKSEIVGELVEICSGINQCKISFHCWVKILFFSFFATEKRSNNLCNNRITSQLHVLAKDGLSLCFV